MKNLISFKFVLTICILFFVSCSIYSPEVNDALKLTGDNKAGYENLLNDYKKSDRRKYEAACFLLGNMPYHISANKVLLDSAYFEYFLLLDSIYDENFANLSLKDQLEYKSKSIDSVRYLLTDKYRELPKPLIQKGDPDISFVTPSFLKDQIDYAFDEWESSPFLKDISFDDFKEFVLPYRTTDESVLYSRIQLKKILENRVPINDTTNPWLAIEHYKVYTDRCRWLNYYIEKTSHLGLFDIFLPKFKMDCHNLATWTSNYFRALGIPVVYEYTPQWPDKPRRHFWCVTPDSSGIFQPYSPPENNMGEDWEESLKYVGKVYRKTFEAQKHSPYFLKGKDEIIPKEFNVPNLKDETFRYHQTVTLRLPFNEATSNKYAYLCFFTISGINPVGWGKVNKKHNEVVFEQVPLNMLFFPAYYENEVLKPFTKAFILKTTGDIDYIAPPRSSNINSDIVDLSVNNNLSQLADKRNNVPDSIVYFSLDSPSTVGDVMVTRKYPLKRNMEQLHKKLKGAFILGANEKSGPFDTLYFLPNPPRPFLQDYDIKNLRKYRYYFFKAPNAGPTNIAHIEFLGNYSADHICAEPTPLPIFSPTEKSKLGLLSKYKIVGTFLKTSSHIESAYDNNYETYVGASKIVVDFRIPVNITNIRLVPRNANNIVVVGDEYQLLYYKDDKWISAGTQKAKFNYLEFTDVPQNTIYWLRNLDHGSEELPFFYQKGKQIFINEMIQ